MRSLPALLLLAALAPSHAADTPVPVVKEPYHKVVLENEYVRVIDVQIPRGVTTQYHLHDIASVVVYLTDSTNASQTWGEAGTTPRKTTPGDSRYAPYDQQSLTHRVTNTGATHFRVYDIELLRPLPATVSFPLKTSKAIESKWEQKLVRSLTLRLEPSGRTEVPASSCAHLLINIGAPVATKSSGGSKKVNAQEYAFFPAKTAFQVNAGAAPAECVLLELR